MRVLGSGPKASDTVADVKAKEAAKSTEATQRAANSSPAQSSSAPAVVVSSSLFQHTQVAGKQESVRAERVADLKAKIASGEYTVDLDRLSEKMVDSAMARNLPKGRARG